MLPDTFNDIITEDNKVVLERSDDSVVIATVEMVEQMITIEPTGKWAEYISQWKVEERI
ncbi:MAG: hypothetical protein ABFD04_11730 [Syntrophomonas sp.]